MQTTGFVIGVAVAVDDVKEVEFAGA